jgi:hypothetical protein
MATTIADAIETLYGGITGLPSDDIQSVIDELASIVGIGSAELDRRGEPLL